jgi:predicted nucleotidyltransferase
MTISDLRNQNLILFEVIAGSKSFGLDTPNSDTDIKGVFYLPKNKYFGLEYIPQISNESNDIVFYELGRFVELLLKNNPNILEILATPLDCIIIKHPIMENLKVEDFLSKLCKETFANYAITQIKKAKGLNKKIINPHSITRKTLLDFCFILHGYSSVKLSQWLEENKIDQAHCGLINIPHSKGVFALFYDDSKSLNYKGIIKNESTTEILTSSIPNGQKEIAYLYFNQDSYSNYCKEHKEYWEWHKKRNEERFKTNKLHGKNYDSKNMMHTIRLLQSAKQILSEGKLNIKVINREELLEIKNGNLEYDEILLVADHLISSIENSYLTSKLIEKPNQVKIENILIEMRKILYQ